MTASATHRSPRRRRILQTAAMVAVLLLAGTAAMLLQDRRLRQIRIERPYYDSLLLPRTEYAKFMAFGYDNLLADYLYIRSLQAFGGRWNKTPDDYRGIFHYFHTITELNPKFMEAYEFGSMVMGESGNDPEAAIALNRKGSVKNPEHYKPAYHNAYICGWELDDPRRAKGWVGVAMLAPDAPKWLEGWLAYFDRETGRYEAAVERQIDRYVEAIRQNERPVKIIARDQIIRTVTEWNSVIIHQALAEYFEDRQAAPPDLETLAREGYFDSYHGCDYPRLRALLAAAEAQTTPLPEDLDRTLTELCIRDGLSGVPRAYEEVTGQPADFRIRRDVRPSDVGSLIEDRELALSEADLIDKTETQLLYLRRSLGQYESTYGFKPLTLDVLDVQISSDPFGGSYVYNPVEGTVKSTSHPEL